MKSADVIQVASPVRQKYFNIKITDLQDLKSVRLVERDHSGEPGVEQPQRKL
jgi:hypothetical protein